MITYCLEAKTMALADLLKLSDKNKKIGLSEERVKAIIPAAR